MVRLTTLAVLLALAITTVNAEWIEVYPRSERYATGHVSRYFGNYSKDGYGLEYGFDFVSGNSNWWVGYAEFDLSTIPDSAFIDYAVMCYYHSSAQVNARVNCAFGDPRQMPAHALFTALFGGSEAAPYVRHSDGWMRRELNATGVRHVQAHLAHDAVLFGVRTPDDFGVGRAQGWDDPNKPYLRIQYFSHVHDAAARGIAVPADTVDSTVVLPTAVVENNGWQTRTFLVRLDFGGSYVSYMATTLTKGEVDTLRFAPWVPPSSGTFTVRCSTMLAGDQDPSNDCCSSVVVVAPGGDVGASVVLAPAGTMDSTTACQPRASMWNHGYGNWTFPVRMRVGPLYSRDTTVTLAPRESTVVVFPEWRASPTGTLAVVCSTMLSCDRNRLNDSCSGIVVVLPGGDVSTIGVLAPRGTLDSGTVRTPQAQVTNLGTVARHCPVRMGIGPTYSADVPVTIQPGDTATVSFPEWTAIHLGAIPVVCSTMLSCDRSQDNDRSSCSTTVLPGGDVRAVAILYPHGRVDSGTARRPRAVFENLGTLARSVPVRMRIGTAYTADSAITLEPGEYDDIYFPEWAASPVGTLVVVCTAMLPCDRNPSNDSLLQFTIVRPTGIQEPEPGLGPPRVSVAANPVRSSRAELQCRFPRETALHVRLYDATGTMVSHTTRDLPKGSSRVNLDLKHQPNGVYLVRLESDSFTTTEKLILQR